MMDRDAFEILREFVSDVDAVGPGLVAAEWPDLAQTYARAKALLRGPRHGQGEARMTARRSHLLGRTIVGFEPHPFRARPERDDGTMAHGPVIILDNGRRLFFVVEETEVGEYGVEVCITERPKRKERNP